MSFMQQMVTLLKGVTCLKSFSSASRMQKQNLHDLEQSSPTIFTPMPTVSNAKPDLMLTGDQTAAVRGLIKVPPLGAVPTWEELITLVNKSVHPIYFQVVGGTDKNDLLRFNNPSKSLSIHDDKLYYSGGHGTETVCQRQFMNKDRVPTFFIFDNYLHAWGFSRRMITAGCTVKEVKFK